MCFQIISSSSDKPSHKETKTITTTVASLAYCSIKASYLPSADQIRVALVFIELHSYIMSHMTLPFYVVSS